MTPAHLLSVPTLVRSLGRRSWWSSEVVEPLERVGQSEKFRIGRLTCMRKEEMMERVKQVVSGGRVRFSFLGKDSGSSLN